MAHLRKNHYKQASNDKISAQEVHRLVQELLQPPPKIQQRNVRYRGRRNNTNNALNTENVQDQKTQRAQSAKQKMEANKTPWFLDPDKPQQGNVQNNTNSKHQLMKDLLGMNTPKILPELLQRQGTPQKSLQVLNAFKNAQLVHEKQFNNEKILQNGNINISNKYTQIGDIKRSVSMPIQTKSDAKSVGSILTGAQKLSMSRLDNLQNQFMTPSYVLQNYLQNLTDYERQEILQYQKIYYFGQNCTKNYNLQHQNYGYDDSRGDYLGKLRDHVAYRYELLELLGEGSFGKVFRAKDHSDGKQIAVKIVKNKKRFHRQGLIEVRLLETLKKHDPGDKSCCLKLQGDFYFRGHLCLICDLFDKNLYEVLVKYNLRGLPNPMVRDIAIQMLTSLIYIYNMQIIHADIKPENILLVAPNQTQVKLIDVGSGCFQGQTVYTYIQSRYYRAPEVILGLPYDCAIDTWSMGCVFCELITGNPIFPGKDEQDQLGWICAYLGLPSQSMLDRSPRVAEFFKAPGKLRSGHRPQSKLLKQHLAQAPQEMYELISQMLVLDPKKRAKPTQLLQTSFCKKYMQNIDQVMILGKGAISQKDKDEMRALHRKEVNVQSFQSGQNENADFTKAAGEMGFVYKNNK